MHTHDRNIEKYAKVKGKGEKSPLGLSPSANNIVIYSLPIFSLLGIFTRCDHLGIHKLICNYFE